VEEGQIDTIGVLVIILLHNFTIFKQTNYQAIVRSARWTVWIWRSQWIFLSMDLWISIS